MATDVKEPVKIVGNEYHGPDRRKPENAQMRQAVEVRLIANQRQRELDRKAAEQEGARKKKSNSLLDW